MRSRLLIGAAGWLLGAVIATAGSLYAVDQLGQGLLAQPTKRVSVAMVNSELAQANTERSSPSAAYPPSKSASRSHPASRTLWATGTVPGQQQRHLSKGGRAMVVGLAGGEAEAVCLHGDAYLIYASPAQGYDMTDQNSTPSPVASVTFSNDSGGEVLRVTCTSSGTPVKHVRAFSASGGSSQDG